MAGFNPADLGWIAFEYLRRFVERESSGHTDTAYLRADQPATHSGSLAHDPDLFLGLALHDLCWAEREPIVDSRQDAASLIRILLNKRYQVSHFLRLQLQIFTAHWAPPPCF